MKFWKTVTLFSCLSIAGFCFFTSYTYGQKKPITLKYSIFFPALHQHSVIATEWGKQIEKRTDGRVKVRMYYAGTLTPAPQSYDGVIKGISDVAMGVFRYMRGRFPLFELFDLPIGTRSGWEATTLINDFYYRFKPKELDEVKVMYLHAHGPAFVHTKKPVYKLEDLKGMKIRTGGLATKIMAALGGVPVAMPMGGTYDALKRGVVEGSVAPFEALEGWKWGEVVKFSTENLASSNPVAFFVVMNRSKWNAFPPDIQRIIEKVNEEWISKTGRAWDEMDKSGKDFVLKRGNKIISLSEDEDRRWYNAVKPLINDYVEKTNAKGMPGDEALKFTMEQLRKIQK